MRNRVDRVLLSTTERSAVPPARRRLAISAILTAMMLVVLDAAMASVALPSIARSLQVTPALSVLVVTAYQLAVLMALLPAAALGERWGYRSVFTAGVTLFTLASLLSASSSSLPCLIAARFLQGLGGAGVLALGVAMLRRVVSPEQLGAAIGWNAVVVALSTAAGPALGAVILAGAEWPWLFALNVPIGLLVLLATRALPPGCGITRRVDLVSVLLHVVVCATFVIGAEIVLTTPGLGTWLCATSVLGAVALVRRELATDTPLIPIDLLRVDTFRLAVLASVCCFAAQATAAIALPFYLHHGRGLSTITTGLYLTLWPLTVALAAPIAGRVAAHVPTACLCAVGGAILSIGLVSVAWWPADASPLPLMGCIMLCGVGFGLFNVPNNHALFLSVAPERSGAAGGLQGTARLVGQTAGAVLMTLLFTVTTIDTAPRVSLAVAAMLTLLAGGVSLLRVAPRP